MANKFEWGGQSWQAGDLNAFMDYLKVHGVDYGSWAANHPNADSILRGGSTPSDANSTGYGYAAPPSGSNDAGGGATQSDANSTGGYGPGTPVPPSVGASPGADNNSSSGSSGPTAEKFNWDGVDFSSYLGIWNLPSDVQARILQIFQSTPDANTAAQIAMSYIRSTGWYAQTYPGIQVAEAKGLVSNEADYRSLLNQQSQVYQQYLGRPITADEYSANLQEGVPTNVIGQRLQGAAYANTYGQDWRYALGAFSDEGAPSQQDLTSLGQEQAGLDTPMGQILKRRLDQAQQRIQGVFKGDLATPSLNLTQGRLQTSAGAAPPDVAA